jgi:ABC-type nitrate/sulfonate/bicarbonate transport system permease component
MKDSHLKTPRTLDECHFTPGYVSHDSKESLVERLAGYALAFVIGCGLAAVLVAWWSS